ncbi:hypothetical protein C8Q72DRAFT_999288 [Fomitopsis betulina]|nr:hypothetical protein C8Q72DRAFT_999288 [Fomitopsis betulina]
MCHPFASVQYCSNRLCFDDDTHDESEDVPSSTPSSTENHNRSCTLAVQPRKPQLCPLSQAQEAAAQVVKRSRRLAMLLGGQEPGSALPAYRPGSVLHGCLAILNSTELLVVHVVVREIAQINISELAGAGRGLTKVLHEDLSSWNSDCDPPLPFRIPFRYTFPLCPPSGGQRPLPPTYHAYMSGIPGSIVHVSYHIAVDMLYTKRQGPSC